jgi:hypothetical protein
MTSTSFIRLSEVTGRNVSTCFITVEAIAAILDHWSSGSQAKSKIVLRDVPDASSVIYVVETPAEVRRVIEIQEIAAAVERDQKRPNTRRKSRGASKTPTEA